MAEPVPREVEAYLLPPCATAERLLAAARSAVPAQAEALLPGGGTQLGPDQMLLCIIHKKVRARRVGGRLGG